MVADIIRLIKSLTKTERLIFFGASAISLVALLFIGINAFYSNTTIQQLREVFTPVFPLEIEH